MWVELQTRDHRIRTCLVLLTVFGIPAFMIWWQVAAMPLRRDAWTEGDESEKIQVNHNAVKNHIKVADIIHKDNNNDGFDVASDVVGGGEGASEEGSGTISSSAFSVRPKMVWLMSFPNSGTSYTMRLVGSASQRAIATNYGPEFTSNEIPVNFPLYLPSPSKETQEEVAGPFWRGSEDDANYKPLPKKIHHYQDTLRGTMCSLFST